MTDLMILQEEARLVKQINNSIKRVQANYNIGQLSKGSCISSMMISADLGHNSSHVRPQSSIRAEDLGRKDGHDASRYGRDSPDGCTQHQQDPHELAGFPLAAHTWEVGQGCLLCGDMSEGEQGPQAVDGLVCCHEQWLQACRCRLHMPHAAIRLCENMQLVVMNKETNAVWSGESEQQPKNLGPPMGCTISPAAVRHSTA